MSTISSLAVKLTLQSAGFIHQAHEAGKSLVGLGDSARQSQAGLRSLGDEAEATEGRMTRLTQSAGSAIAALVGIGSLGAGLGLGIKLAAELEQTEIAFKTMLGSAAAAKKMLTEIRTFAAATPFQIPELASAAKVLLAYQIPAEDILTTLRQLGDVASATGSNLGELTLSYGKAATQGKLLAQDIREFTGRGVPLIKLLADQFGVAESEVMGLVSAGKVGFRELQIAIQTATSEGGIFYQSTAQQSQTLAGLWSTLKDSINSVLMAFGDAFAKALDIAGGVRSLSAAFDMLKPVAEVAGALLGTLASWAVSIAGALAPVIVAWKAFTVTLGVGFAIVKTLVAIRIAQWIAGFLGLRVAALAFQGGMLLVRAAYVAATYGAVIFHAMSGPKGWAILAAGAVAAAAAVYGLKKAYDSLNAAGDTSALGEKALTLLDAVTDESAAVQSANEAADQRKAIDEKLAETGNETWQLGMTDTEKKLDDFSRMPGVTAEDKFRMRQELTQQDARRKALEEEEKRAKEIAKLQKEAADHQKAIAEEVAGIQRDSIQANMTEAQKKFLALWQKGASFKDLGQAAKALGQQEVNRARQEKLKAMATEAESLKKSLATPLEEHEAKMKRLKELFDAGKITADTFNRGSAEAFKKLDDATRTEYKPIAALERGSSAAFSAIQSNRAPKTPEQILEQAKRHNELLQQIADNTKSDKPEVAGVKR